MKTVVVDKIASITQACTLGHELRIADEIIAEEGVVVVAEILNNKSSYNTLELTSGRMAKVAKGDVVVGALGPRKALFGYSGHVPESLRPGDVIQMLNIGGVMGVCDSATPDKGKPFDCRVLGVVLRFPYLGEPIGAPARVGFGRRNSEAALDAPGVPVVALAATCMVLSANDPVAAWGGVKLLRERFHIEPCMVTGPSTDNQVGIDIIEQQLKVPACNAISNPAPLGDAIIEAVGLGARASVAGVSE